MTWSKKMSTKKKHMYDKVWHELRAICFETGCYVTAGQFANHYGVSRTTAKKWLAEMLSVKAIVAITVKAKNGVMATCYATGDNLVGGENVAQHKARWMVK